MLDLWLSAKSKLQGIGGRAGNPLQARPYLHPFQCFVHKNDLPYTMASPGRTFSLPSLSQTPRSSFPAAVENESHFFFFNSGVVSDQVSMVPQYQRLPFLIGRVDVSRRHIGLWVVPIVLQWVGGVV